MEKSIMYDNIIIKENTTDRINNIKLPILRWLNLIIIIFNKEHANVIEDKVKMENSIHFDE